MPTSGQKTYRSVAERGRIFTPTRNSGTGRRQLVEEAVPAGHGFPGITLASLYFVLKNHNNVCAIISHEWYSYCIVRPSTAQNKDRGKILLIRFYCGKSIEADFRVGFFTAIQNAYRLGQAAVGSLGSVHLVIFSQESHFGSERRPFLALFFSSHSARVSGNNGCCTGVTHDASRSGMFYSDERASRFHIAEAIDAREVKGGKEILRGHVRGGHLSEVKFPLELWPPYGAEKGWVIKALRRLPTLKRAHFRGCVPYPSYP